MGDEPNARSGVAAGVVAEPSDAPAGPVSDTIVEIVTDSVLRPALELGFAVAVIGARQRPPQPPPTGLRPYLRFQKLPAAALGPLRRAIDADAAFRMRVAAIADEEVVGRESWLWLARPDGWLDELAKLAADHDAGGAPGAPGTPEAGGDGAVAGDREERRAAKRLEAVEQALVRAKTESAELRAELASLRSRRDDATSGVERLTKKVNQLDIELAGARRRLTEANNELAAADERERDGHARLRASRDEAAALQARLAEIEAASDAASPAPVVPVVVTPVVDAERRVVAASRLDRADAATFPAGTEDLINEAARASRHLADVLEALHASMPDDRARPSSNDRPPLGAESISTRPRRVPSLRRTKLALPGGVLADSVEAAEHLLRQDALVLVDGYNVAKLGWPAVGLADQRERLLQAMRELVARFGSELRVVFDGADVGHAPPRRRSVQVTFSPSGVSADDVVVQFVEALPATRAVVVVTNDQELRARVARLGATLLCSEQLLAAARR